MGRQTSPVISMVSCRPRPRASLHLSDPPQAMLLPLPKERQGSTSGLHSQGRESYKRSLVLEPAARFLEDLQGFLWSHTERDQGQFCTCLIARRQCYRDLAS